MKDVIANEKLPYIPDTFKVQLYKELYDDNDPLYGQFDYDEQIIRIRIFKDNGKPLSRNVFLTHIIMNFSTPLTICGILEVINRLLVLLQC